MHGIIPPKYYHFKCIDQLKLMIDKNMRLLIDLGSTSHYKVPFRCDSFKAGNMVDKMRMFNIVPYS